MFITGHSYAGLFLLAVVSNFVVIDAADNSDQQNAFPTAGVGKDETHLFVKKTGEHMVVKRSAARKEKCILFDFDAILVLHDPGDYNNIKRTKITLSSQSMPNRRCTIEPPDDKRELQIEASNVFSMYTLAFAGKKSADGKSWYVDYFEVAYSSSLVFGHTNYGTAVKARTRPNENFMETPIDKSFSCTGLWKVLLYNKQGNAEVELHFSRIKMQFYNIGDGDKYSPEFLCSASPVYAAITWLQLVAIWLLYHFV